MIYKEYEARQDRVDAQYKSTSDIYRYNESSKEVKLAFKQALEVEHEVLLNPKKELLWNYAWEHGHAEGYMSVEYIYADLADLLEKDNDNTELTFGSDIND